MELRVESLACGYGRRRVVEGFSVTISSGEVFCLLGPNGVGKTTLFKTMLGLIPPLAGRVLADGRDLAKLLPKDRAKLLGYVPQAQFTPFAYSVLEVILMGRTARTGFFGRPGPSDLKIAERTIDLLGIGRLADRAFTELSGGERQMVILARALAQEPEFLLMDEPTSSLDFGNQLKVLCIVKSLAESGLGVVLTTHLPDHVFHCGHRAALMRNGRDFLIGPVGEVMTSESLSATYGVTVKVLELSDGLGRVCRQVAAGGGLLIRPRQDWTERKID
jgi:iron complex transport system ATP-binding protein